MENENQLVINEDHIPYEGNEKASAAIEVQQSKAVQEVQAKLVIAKKFPRDEVAAYAKIMKACKRISLAEQAIYSLPIGGKSQTGPSIRLAEVLIQSWGNASYGIKEVSREKGRSHCIAFCWDQESNMSVEQEFTVEHWIEVGKKGEKTKRPITDPVEIDRLISNRGSRKVRNAILAVIPGDIVDAALKECKVTLSKGGGEPLSDRIRKMVMAFSEISVTQEMIENRLKRNVENTSAEELVELQSIYKSLIDKQAKREDFFTHNDFDHNEEKKEIIDRIEKMGK